MSADEQREVSATSGNGSGGAAIVTITPDLSQFPNQIGLMSSGSQIATLQNGVHFTYAVTDGGFQLMEPESLADVEIEINVESEDGAAATMTCPNCGADVPAGATTCPECGQEMEMAAASDPLPPWEGELAFEGLPSSDGRVLMAGEITNRDLPLTLMFQYVTDEGHKGAEACGNIAEIWREPRPEMGDGVVAVMGRGEFSNDMMGPTAASSVENKIVRHVSIDLAPTKKVCLNAKTLQEVPEDELDFTAFMNGEYLIGISGEIMGATIVPFSAFADAQMRIVETPDAVVASASGSFRLVPRVITASAAGMAPVHPKKDWFFQPEPDGKFPLTVMDDGRIMGHLATWDQCHHGFANTCVLAKKSKSGYAYFHTGQLKTAEGELINVGRIVVGEHERAGHAGLVDLDRVNATRHYDKTALVGAFVRAIDGKYGIWLSGVVRSDCPAERVRDMIANPPSGDWRYENGCLELIAALSVPVAGFPVPRYEYAMVASGEDAEVKTLIATGYFELDPPTFSRAERRRKEVLVAKAKGELS